MSKDDFLDWLFVAAVVAVVFYASLKALSFLGVFKSAI